MRYVFLALALLSIFFFPYPLTVLLSFVASLYVPIAGLLIGILADLVYYTPHASSLPLATMYGAAASLLAYILRRFVRARLAV